MAASSKPVQFWIVEISICSLILYDTRHGPTPMPVAMGGSAVSVVGQNMYLQGSFGTGATNLNYSYDFVANA